MKTKVPVAEMKGVQENVINEYWMKYYCGPVLCSLCGNKGIIDTRLTAREGRLNYCICPNGRVMRDNPKQYPLQTKSTIFINSMRFDVAQPTVDCADIIKLVYGEVGNTSYMVSYADKNDYSFGYLKMNDRVNIEEGMRFTVVMTNA